MSAPALEVLAALRQIAESQGRQFQAVLDDALRDYIDRHQNQWPRRHGMAAFADSLVANWRSRPWRGISSPWPTCPASMPYCCSGTAEPLASATQARWKRALFRPQTGYHDDIVAEAAALTESLAMIHPFVDGNKRIAFAATDVFLRFNGWHLLRPSMQIHAEMLRMFESGKFDVEHLDSWLRSFASPHS